MKNGFAVLALILGIVIGAFVVGGAAYLYNRANPSTSTTTPSTSTAEPTPPTSEQSTQDETADWQTYTDSTYGYSIHYPSDWRKAISGTNSWGFGPASVPEDTSVGVNVVSSPLLEAKQSLPVLTMTNKVNKVIKEEVVVVANIPWLKLTIKQDGSGTTFVDHLTEKNGKTYAVGVGTDDSATVSIYNKMLATFKFTQ